MIFLDEEEKAVEITEAEVVENAEAGVLQEEKPVEEKLGKIEKQSKNKNKRPSKVKGAFSELKKVTWPTFGRVVKETIVVLSVTAIFLVVIMGIDRLLYLLFDVLTKNMGA